MDRFRSPAPARFGQTTGGMLGAAAASFGTAYGGAAAQAAPRFNSYGTATPQQQATSAPASRSTPFAYSSTRYDTTGSSWADITEAANQYRLGQKNLIDPATGINTGAGGGQGGALTTSGRFDDANGVISQTGQRWGVPPAVLKAIINRESSGDWNRNGNRFPQIRGGAGGYILPYVGIFANAWTSWGCPGSASQAVGNQAAQVDCLARGLRSFYDRSPSKSWESVASMHFSGQWNPNSGWRDENGMSVQQYVSSFMREVSQFGTIGPSTSGAAPTGGSGVSGNLSTVWGGKGSPNLAYGFGAKNSLPYYDYGKNYGMNGFDHTGIDVPMPVNSPVYTPVSGTVVCACTGSGGGCSAFNDYIGSGCGRIEIRMDNGHHVILGHTSKGMVQLGARVNAGQQVATSGGMNGPHTHVEYRVPDSSMGSGFRIVDPAKYLSGGAIPTSGAAGTTGSPTPQAVSLAPWESRYNQRAQMQQAARGYGDITGWRSAIR